MRLRVRVLPLVALVAACSVATVTTTSTPSSTTTSPSEPDATTTTAVEPADGAAATTLLISNADGLSTTTVDGPATQVIAGRVAHAAADQLGGIVFQVDSGTPPDADASWSTAIWWLPEGSAEPVEVLSRDDGADLTLHDAYGWAGDLAIVYSRTERVPAGEGVHSSTSSVRLYRASDGYADEIWRIPTFEHHYRITASPTLMAAAEHDVTGTRCSVFDTGGYPSQTYDPGPLPGDAELIDCALSDDGHWLAIAVLRTEPAALEIRVVFTLTGSIRTTLEVPVDGSWEPSGIDISSGHADVPSGILVVNRSSGGVSGRALVFDVTAPDRPPRLAPIAGHALALSQPIEAGPVEASSLTPSARTVTPDLILRSDGLGPVSLGTSLPDAEASLVGILGPPTLQDRRQWEDSVGIHNGFPVDRSYIWLSWQSVGLEAVFSDGVGWQDGRTGPVLVWWGYAGTDVTAAPSLATDTGLTVGSPGSKMEEIYGSDLVLAPTNEYFPWQAGPDEPAPFTTMPALSPIRFFLSGDPERPGSHVTSIWAGAAQSP